LHGYLLQIKRHIWPEFINMEMLFLDIEVGDHLQVGQATIRLLHKSGRKAGLKISAPQSVKVKLRKISEQGTEDPETQPMRTDTILQGGNNSWDVQ
jgi:hypothetical protein